KVVAHIYQVLYHHMNSSTSVTNHREREREYKKQPSGYQKGHGSHGKHQVLPDNQPSAPGQLMRIREPAHVLRQKRHIGRMEGYVRACHTHGDPDISAGECGCVG